MSKISIVLSAILVISGISADNADCKKKNIASPEDCKKSVEEVRIYVEKKFSEIPSWIQDEWKDDLSVIRKSVDAIAKGIPDEEMEVSHNITAPSGKIMKCNYASAFLLEKTCKNADKIYKSAMKKASKS